MKGNKQKIENHILKNIKKIIKWIILAICTIIILEIVENLLQNEIHVFDNGIYHYIAKVMSAPMTTFAKIITYLRLCLCNCTIVCHTNGFIWEETLGKIYFYQFSSYLFK